MAREIVLQKNGNSGQSGRKSPDPETVSESNFEIFQERSEQLDPAPKWQRPLEAPQDKYRAKRIRS